MSDIDGALSDIAGALKAPPIPQIGGQDAMPASRFDDALADFSKTPDQLRAEIPTPPKEGGFVRNIAAGGNDMAASILGAPVDAMTGAVNAAGRYRMPIGENAFPPDMQKYLAPETPPPPIQNPFGGSESIKSAMGVIGADPRNIGVNNWQDQAAREIGGGAVAMAAPYMGARAMIAHGVEGIPGAVAGFVGGPAAADAGMARTAAGAAANVAIGGAGAAGGNAAENLLPENSPYRPLANMAGQMAAGGLVAGGLGLGKAGINFTADQAREHFGPMFQSVREQNVASRLRQGASDFPAFSAALDNPNPELVPGSKPTTYQLTGDQGIGQLERQQRTVNPAPFLERAGEQNAARVGGIEALAPENANPATVRGLFQTQLSNLDTQGEADVTAAQRYAHQALDATGGRLTREDYGALMRDQLEASKSAAKQRESALWRAIDPEGNLTINGAPAQAAATDILKSIPNTAKPPDGEEKAVLGFAQLLGTAAPFQDFAALRGRLLQAIREERGANGESPALRRMQQLRSAMDNTMSGTVENVADQQAQAVAAGQMQPEQTIFGKLLGEAQSHFADRNTAAPVEFRRLAAGGVNGEGGAGNANVAGTGGGVPATYGSQGAQGVGPRGIAGNPSLQGEAQPVAPWDEAAQSRYRAAADATRTNAETFKNQTIGPVLTAGRNQPYRLSDAQVPERFLSSSDGVKAFVDAGGQPNVLQDALVGDLRRQASNPDGSLNPNRYQSWLRNRADALRSFPDLQTRLANVANAQTAVDTVSGQARQQLLDYQQGAARHFLNAEPMQAVQSAFASKNPVADFAALNTLTGADPDARAGLQRAVADYMRQRFVGNTEAGTTGVGTLKSDTFQTFLSRNKDALSNIYSPEQMKSMQAIAEDLQRSNRSVVGSKLPGQSNTAQDLTGLRGKMSMLREYVAQGAVTGLGGIGGFLYGGVPGAIGGASSAAMAKSIIDKMTRSGIERTDQLMTEALLNPELANALLTVASPGNRPFIAHRLGSALGTLAGASAVEQTRH